MGLAERVAAALDVEGAQELAGGHQSRVFRTADRNGWLAVAKVLDASMVDRADLDARLDVAAALADLDVGVCRPLATAGSRIVELASANGLEHYIVCYELAVGNAPDPALPDDARRMGAALARLHRAMRALPQAPLPLVAALRDVPAAEITAAADRQLLHGDFSASNLRMDGGDVRIFDLDDCGYGPPAHDVANALYMVLFDSATHGAAETYGSFRPSFLDGYASASGTPLADESLDRFIDLRVRALGAWLDDLDSAPIGIRTASPTWRATLRTFVSDHG